MDYRESVAYLYDLGRFGVKLGLENITTLLHRLDNPQDRMPVVHVAGTNGKGSTASFLASIMAAAGYSVGLFTSPHLIHFSERIVINGRQIAEPEVIDLVARISDEAPVGTTFFEFVTAMACLYFAEQKVDLAILEVGMGGRFDATNAVAGILSVVTPVSLDHCEYLGDSLAAVATEKAGIIKPGRPVVSASQVGDALAILNYACVICASQLYAQGTSFTYAWEGETLAYKGLALELYGLRPALAGRYQGGNAATALCAAEVLAKEGFPLTEKAFRTGIETAIWPGRMETFAGVPPIILDGAHNPAGATALAESLASFPRERLILVVGIMADKDVAGILGPLLPYAHEVIAVTPAIPRALPASDLATACTTLGLPATVAGSVGDGLALARRHAGAGDIVLVCGSLFTVGEARALLTQNGIEPFRG